MDTEVWYMSQGKALVLTELWPNLPAFSTEYHCYLKKRLTQLWLFRVGHLADILSRINKVSLSLQEKQYALLQIKLKLSREN